MGLFGKKSEGGLMDVIRCDLPEYLVWKWSPDGSPSKRENAIRYGSSLRVKDGEVAVFVYRQKDGSMQDYIEGPYDQTIKTANFPILTSIVGTAFGGASPFQAEIYYINLAGNIQLNLFLEDVYVADPRFLDFGAPVDVKGTITFNIQDYKAFIKLNRMIEFDLDDFRKQISGAVRRYVRQTVTNAPKQLGLPLTQIETSIDPVSVLVEQQLRAAMANDFGVHVKRVDISNIELNKESDAYKELKANTADIQSQKLQVDAMAMNQNTLDMQAINAANYQEALRVQREETQRAQRLQTEMANLTAHQIDVQGDVARTAAESLGELGGSAGSSMGDGGGGMNPAAMMTGMMMGGAIGGSMSNMMGNMMSGLNQPQPPAPPVMSQYHISVNGQQAGPYTLDQLRQMVSAGQLTRETYVWKTGMAAWDSAGNVQETAALFGAVPPPPPPGSATPPPPPAL